MSGPGTTIEPPGRAATIYALVLVSGTPRTILYTGKGGVGKTSIAAATARRCAAAGLRTIVVSTDPAHSLSDVLGTPVGPEPRPLASNLHGQEISARAEMIRHWSAVKDWFGGLLIGKGVDRISAEELSVPPGMDELFSLLAIERHHASGDYDAIVVDCAPTGETLRLLAFPDVARWWLERVFPAQGRFLDAVRPLARSMLDITLPGNDALDEIGRLVENLIAMHAIVADTEHTSVRLVMTPDKMVVDEARRTFTYLNLYGYLTDAVIVNRVFGADTGAYFQAWRERQLAQLEAVNDGFAPVPVLQAPYFEEEVLGDQMLDRLADAIFAAGDHDPAAVLHREIAEQLTLHADGTASLRLPLPLAERGELVLKRIGPELVVGVADHRRTILLPPALEGLEPSAAKLVDGVLEIGFTTAPAGDGRVPAGAGRR